MRVKSSPVAFKAGPEDGLAEGEFIVYPSTFTRTPDSYGDVVAKGAFVDSIEYWKSSGNVLPGLFGHRMDDPDYYVAEAVDMGEDEHGWWVKGRFDLESPKGAQVYRLVRSKRLTKMSFAYDILDEAVVTLGNGAKANELRKLHVHEFSFVPIGANSDAGVLAVKEVARELASRAGRVISAPDDIALRKALQSLEDSAEQIKSFLDASRDEGNDQEQATVAAPDEAADVSAPSAPSALAMKRLAAMQLTQIGA